MIHWDRNWWQGLKNVGRHLWKGTCGKGVGIEFWGPQSSVADLKCSPRCYLMSAGKLLPTYWSVMVLFTSRHSITSQKTWIFSKTAERTSNLNKVFCVDIDPFFRCWHCVEMGYVANFHKSAFLHLQHWSNWHKYPFWLCRVFTLSENCRWSLSATTPIRVWAVGWDGYINL